MTDRFAALMSAARADSQPPLFVSQASKTSRVSISQLDGGRDAKYLLISTNLKSSVKEIIGYRPDVAGTDLIYDLSAETMQGKARPFACEVANGEPKVYALMPVQMEAINVHIATTDKGRILRVEFQDALGERLQAVLPFHLRLECPEDKPLKQGYGVTDRDGRYASPPLLLADAPAGSRIIIRSQLTGGEKSVRIVP